MIRTCESGTKNERIWRLREEIMARRGSWVAGANPFLRDVAIYRASQHQQENLAWHVSMLKNDSVVQRRAKMLVELVKGATIQVEGEWRLAGEHLAHWFGRVDPKNAEHRAKLAELGIEDAEGVAEAVKKWEDREMYYAVGETETKNQLGFGNWSGDHQMVYFGFGWLENHSIRDYAKVVRIGYGGIKREIEAKLAAADIAESDYVQKENFWRAGMMVCEAGIELGRRYAEAARSAGKTEMAAMCERVPAEGARTLPEAVQTLWMAHILTCGEDDINANSLGRLDQIFYPYYKADIEAGRITRDGAVELMEELACKLYLEYDVQAITLGGQDREGRCAVNEMSYIILEATRNVEFIRDLSVRLTEQTPKAFVDLCASLVVKGGGIPFFFNDDCFVKALSDRGIAVEDARGYSPIGCVEITIPGMANPHPVSGWINAAKCLELALFDGKDPRTGEQLGLHTGKLTDFRSYDDLIKAYRKQLELFSKRMIYHINRGELKQREKGPLPCWSILTDNCIERGRDITDGGAKYMYHSICFMGTANTADSLRAMEKLVFKEGKVGKAELLEALRTNFEGAQGLRQMLLNDAEKYGNDQKEVDEIAAWVANDFIDLMDGYRSALGGRFHVHLFSFLQNVYFGRGMGATPDGRKAGEPIAYSLSAQQGRDEKGVTAMLNSLSKLPHDRAAGASAAIIDIDPKLVQGQAGIDRLSQIVRAAIRMGVGQMQFNVVTEERLRQAQTEPEKYGNIPVRVAGYSQMFKLLPAELQEHVIARTKHRN
jgi:formate C-acetyltransferase